MKRKKRNEVCTFLRRHTILPILAIIFVYAIIKQTSIPTPLWIPQSIRWIFERVDLKSEYYDLADLSSMFGFAYLSSLFFYILVDYIPKRKAETKVFKLFTHSFSKIANRMDFIIGMYNHAIQQTKSILEITESDLLKLKSLPIDHTTMPAHIEYCRNGAKCFSNSYHLIRSPFEKMSEIICEISEMRQCPYYANIENEMLDLIEGIYYNSLLKHISKLFNEPPIEYPVTNGNLDIEVYGFIKLYIKLIEYGIAFDKYNFCDIALKQTP